MHLAIVLTRYAQLERRAMVLYRALATRFAAVPDAARRWQEMSDAEAGHFAVLGLAEDWVALGGAASTPTPITEESLDLLGQRLTTLEEAAGREACGLAEAVEISLTWEELEMPRVAALIDLLGEPARGRVRAGLVAEAEAHVGSLRALVAAGAPALAPRVAALGDQARATLAGQPAPERAP
jgi:hypothetical protein